LFACDETEIIKVSAGCFTGRAGGSAAHGWGVRLKSIPGGDCWHPLNGYVLRMSFWIHDPRLFAPLF